MTLVEVILIAGTVFGIIIIGAVYFAVKEKYDND